jgi:hypothetical protein
VEAVALKLPFGLEEKLSFRVQLKRDTNYYFGLALFIAASLTIVWAIYKDAFDPKDFLVYFLIYSWGYVILLKSDYELRVSRLEKEILHTKDRLDQLTKPTDPITDIDEDIGDSKEFIPGLHADTSIDTKTETKDIYNVWTEE